MISRLPIGNPGVWVDSGAGWAFFVVRRDKTGMLLGMQESYKKGESESILAPSLTDGVARRRPKRRQGYRWAGLLSFEKRGSGC
jgi:hypothetical protein